MKFKLTHIVIPIVIPIVILLTACKNVFIHKQEGC